MGYVEREAFAAATLVARMADKDLDPAPVWDDLESFDGRPWRGKVDLISAGYPCQPFSVAGKRQGQDDERHLWPEVARIIREVEPAGVFLENVPGHLRLGFREVADELRDMGYRVAAGLFTAAEVGAPHRRDRLFALAHAPVGDPDREGLESRSPDAEPGSLSSTWPPGPSGDWSAAPGWLWPAVESGVRGVADGTPGRVDRLRSLGNGVVPLVAAYAFTTLEAMIAPMTTKGGFH